MLIQLFFDRNLTGYCWLAGGISGYQSENRSGFVYFFSYFYLLKTLSSSCQAELFTGCVRLELYLYRNLVDTDKSHYSLMCPLLIISTLILQAEKLPFSFGNRFGGIFGHAFLLRAA